MEIKTSAVNGHLNTPIELEKLLPLENYRISNKHGYLSIGKITASIYKTGKIQIYGIKNPDDIPKIWGVIIGALGKYVDVSRVDALPELKFLLGIDKLPYPVDLNKIKTLFPDEDIDYEPEQFPGLIWRFEKGTAILFTSGSITLTGFVSLKDAENQFVTIKKDVGFDFILNLKSRIIISRSSYLFLQIYGNN